MKRRFIGLVVLGMVLSFSAMSCGGDGDDDDKHHYYYQGPIGVVAIINEDVNMDGSPDDSYFYMIMIRDDSPNNMLSDPPVVTLPGGSTLPTVCYTEDNETVCTTAMQTPPGGLKTSVPDGDYNVANNGGYILAFTVLSNDLLNPDPAYADVASLVPSSPGNLDDPAILDWDATPGGVAGDNWEFGVENADSGDDDGEYFGNESDWADSNFSLDLPDTWDDTDPLEVEIISQKRNEMAGYYQVLMVRILVTGFILDK